MIGVGLTLHLGKYVYLLWNPFVNVSDLNVIPPFPPSQVGDYYFE